MIEAAFHTPHTVGEASDLLVELDNSALVSGGQWLVPRIRSHDITLEHVISTHELSELKGIQGRSDLIIIGAGETHNTIATSFPINTELPSLADMARKVGDQQVRNRGTIGGALVSSPEHTDYSLALLGLDGSLKTNKRQIPADAFLDSTSASKILTDEILISIEFSIPQFATYKKIPHPAANHADAGVFLSKFDNGETRIIVSGSNQWPVGLLDAELSLKHNKGIFSAIEKQFQHDVFFASRLCALLEECLGELP
ncbi:MAG: FAD binding domain-containing protein [Pseudomonadota bacterium]